MAGAVQQRRQHAHRRAIAAAPSPARCRRSRSPRTRSISFWLEARLAQHVGVAARATDRGFPSAPTGTHCCRPARRRRRGCAPSDSARSPKASASRSPAPSSSMPIAKLDGAELAAEVGAVAAVELVASSAPPACRGARPGSPSMPFFKRRALQRREFQFREGLRSSARRRLRSTSLAVVVYFASTGGSTGGAGVTATVPRPVRARSPGSTTSVWLPLPSQRSPVARTLAGGGVVERLQAVAKAAGIAGEHRALGQRVGLAAEAADALDAAHEAGLEHRARLRQLRSRSGRR